ncbi:MAG: hypothetical protein R3280_03200 [Marinobacter sp.]|uniref:hypothetical protein n=1 Tax=Marinobacter sp. TaxID=50741 RepID=UPI00299E62B6|nr:hypothetical protein [Marinobacter sp.]MDX1633622.1 hypothetical protein [Marinobacter sp.]
MTRVAGAFQLREAVLARPVEAVPVLAVSPPDPPQPARTSTKPNTVKILENDLLTHFSILPHHFSDDFVKSYEISWAVCVRYVFFSITDLSIFCHSKLPKPLMNDGWRRFFTRNEINIFI